jgi:hypothetical protein
MTQYDSRGGSWSSSDGHRPTASEGRQFTTLTTRTTWVLFVAAVLATVMGMANPSIADNTIQHTLLPLTLPQLAMGAAALWGLVLAIHDLASGSSSVPRPFVVVVLAYVGWELVVVLPAALLFKNAPWLDVLRTVTPRAAPFLVAIWAARRAYPIVGPALLRHSVSVAAAFLGYWTLGLYVVNGPTTWMEGDVVRLRMLWGSAAALFAWGILDGLIYSRRMWLSLIVLPGATAGLVLTNVRSAYLGLALALLVQVPLRHASRAVLAVGVILLAWIAVGYMQPAIQQSILYSVARVPNPSVGDARDRVQRWSASWEYIESHYLGDRAQDGFPFLLTPRGRTYSSHDMFLEVLVSEGVAGLALVVALLTLTVKSARRYWRNDVVSFSLTYLGFYVVFCVFNSTWYLAQVQLVLALCVAGALTTSAGSRTASARLPQGDSGYDRLNPTRTTQ